MAGERYLVVNVELTHHSDNYVFLKRDGFTTCNLDKAGRYDKLEAVNICQPVNGKVFFLMVRVHKVYRGGERLARIVKKGDSFDERLEKARQDVLNSEGPREH